MGGIRGFLYLAFVLSVFEPYNAVTALIEKDAVPQDENPTSGFFTGSNSINWKSNFERGLVVEDTFCLTTLHINDLHSKLEARTGDGTAACPCSRDSQNGDSACHRGCRGGVARAIELMRVRKQQIQKENEELTSLRESLSDQWNGADALGTSSELPRVEKQVLILDAGDQFQGSVFYSYYKGNVSVELQNYLLPDAMAVGNHEFDDGPQNLAKYISKAHFPVLSANADVRDEDELNGEMFKYNFYPYGYIVKDFSDDSEAENGAGAPSKKVAIIGMTAEDTSLTSNAGDKVLFMKSKQVLAELVPHIQKQGVNKIILLSHLGYPLDREIANEVAGIDLIVGGHSHVLLERPTMENGVPIVQVGAFGTHVGEIEICFNPAGEAQSISFASENEANELTSDFPEDQSVLELLREKKKEIDAKYDSKIGTATDAFGTDVLRCRVEECEIGNLVSEACTRHDLARRANTDLTFFQGGGLRSTISKGEITKMDAFEVLPFQNNIAFCSIKGKYIVLALELGVSQVYFDQERQELTHLGGAFPQLYNMRFVWDISKPVLPGVHSAGDFEDLEMSQKEEKKEVDAAAQVLNDDTSVKVAFPPSKKHFRLSLGSKILTNHELAEYSSQLESLRNSQSYTESNIKMAQQNPHEASLTDSRDTNEDDFSKFASRVLRVEVFDEDKQIFETIDLDKHYRIATSDFVTEGGDGFWMIEKYCEPQPQDESEAVPKTDLMDILAEYIESQQIVSPVLDERIRMVGLDAFLEMQQRDSPSIQEARAVQEHEERTQGQQHTTEEYDLIDSDAEQHTQVSHSQIDFTGAIAQQKYQKGSRRLDDAARHRATFRTELDSSIPCYNREGWKTCTALPRDEVLVTSTLFSRQQVE